MADTTHGFRALYDDDFMRDPYPVYSGLREEAAAQEVVTPLGVKVWLVARHADVRDLLADPRLRKNARTVRALSEQHAVRRDERRGIANKFPSGMLGTDPPDHTRLRRLVSKEFTRARVEALRPEIEGIAGTLLRRVSPGQVVDIMDAYALPLPVMVICRLLGIPAEDHEEFQSWSNIAINSSMPADDSRKLSAAVTEYLRRLVAAKRANPGDDLVSGLVAARDDEDRLSEVELIGMIFLLVLAGHETTARLIGNSILALLANPDQIRLLRADPGLLPGAVEEFLRYAGPAGASTPLYTTEPVRVGDVTIPENEIVLLSMASAGRDPAMFDEPDRLDVTRDAAGHLAFGHGIHFCIGSHLARAEATIALRKLLERFRNWELAAGPGDMKWRFSPLIHGVDRLPVRLN